MGSKILDGDVWPNPQFCVPNPHRVTGDGDLVLLFPATKIVRVDTVAVGRICIAHGIPVSARITAHGKCIAAHVAVGIVRLRSTHGVGIR